MVCIYCGSKLQVANSRQTKRLPGTWRRRHCAECDTTFSTVETLDYPKTMVITHSNGATEAFVRDRLFISLYECLKHRKTAQGDATALTDTVISKLLADFHSPQLTKRRITEVTVQILKRFDKAAATQYAAYHPTK